MTQYPPNLFIPGMAKSGTTTLADALRQHPEVFITPTKEPTFFSSDINYARGMDWYLDTYFPTAGDFRYRGDASPSYIYFADKVGPRMQADLGRQGLKFLLIFRNPVDRAYSHYWHNVHRWRQENLSFEQALEAEQTRLRETDKELNDLGRIRYAYYTAGLYSRQLRTFWKYYPRADCLLLLYEDLQREQYPGAMQRVQEFLGLTPVPVKYAHSNPSYRARSRLFDRIVRGPSLVKQLLKRSMPVLERGRIKTALLRWNAEKTQYAPMAPATRKRLREQYASEVMEFESIIGRDLSAWRG
jgi:hypothetical protein